MIIFEIKYQGKRLYLPKIDPGSTDKKYPYFFPEAHETGMLSIFTNKESARKFIRSHGLPVEVEHLIFFDLERIKRWSENPFSIDVDAEQLDLFYMTMVDYFTERPKDLPKFDEFEFLRLLNQQLGVKTKYEILSKALLENPMPREDISLEMPNEELLHTTLKQPRLKDEVRSLIVRFDKCMHIVE